METLPNPTSMELLDSSQIIPSMETQTYLTSMDLLNYSQIIPSMENNPLSNLDGIIKLPPKKTRWKLFLFQPQRIYSTLPPI